MKKYFNCGAVIFFIVASLAGFLFFGNTSTVAAASNTPEKSMDIFGKSIVSEPYCKGVVYSFTLPASGVNFRGLSGYASMIPTEPIFTQSLVWVADVPSGNCPASGSVLDEAALPPHPWLASYILKSSNNEPVKVETNFELVKKVPIKGCVIVIVGGCGVRQTTLTSESHISLLYDTEPLNEAPAELVSLSYEFGFGGAAGQLKSTGCTQRNCSFASVWRADKPYLLYNLYGNVAAAGISGDSVLIPPKNNWGVDFDYYLYKNCSAMTPGLSGAADFYANIPGDAIALQNIHGTVNSQWDGPLQDKIYQFGAAGDQPIVGDWNGDGKTEVGNYKGNGVWTLDYNGNGIWDGVTLDRWRSFGAAGDQPIVGDWNGDGKTEVGNYKGNGLWALDYNGNGMWDGTTIDRTFIFGAAGDQPIVGDWNGDGKTEIGNYKGNGVWALDFNGNGQWDGPTSDKLYSFGSSTDQPVTGDWNGDGKTEVGNYKGNGLWALDYNGNGMWDGTTIDRTFIFGAAGDQPIVGDWNGDGKDDLGAYRPLSANWYLDYNSNGALDFGSTKVGAFHQSIAKNFPPILIEPGNCLVGLNRIDSSAGGSIDTEAWSFFDIVPNACQNSCVSGSKQCSGNGYQVCGDSNGDGCLEWSSTINCGTNQICSNSECKSNSICAAKTCAILGNYQCGSWSDGCGKTISCGTCATGKTCSNGQCALNCVSRASKKCDSGNLYWYNSCNTKEELAQDCGTDTPTSNYRCNGNWTQSETVKKGCASNACVSEAIWTNDTDCNASGKTCSVGVCVVTGTTNPPATNPPAPNPPVKPVTQMNRAEILARIAQIQALIADMQKQLAVLTGGPATISCAQITKNLFYGTKNDPQAVRCLQEVLKSQNYAVTVSGNYDVGTKAAVINLQQKYASEILAPFGLRYGSGNVGNATRAKINALMAK